MQNIITSNIIKVFHEYKHQTSNASVVNIFYSMNYFMRSKYHNLYIIHKKRNNIIQLKFRSIFLLTPYIDFFFVGSTFNSLHWILFKPEQKKTRPVWLYCRAKSVCYCKLCYFSIRFMFGILKFDIILKMRFKPL